MSTVNGPAQFDGSAGTSNKPRQACSVTPTTCFLKMTKSASLPLSQHNTSINIKEGLKGTSQSSTGGYSFVNSFLEKNKNGIHPAGRS